MERKQLRGTRDFVERFYTQINSPKKSVLFYHRIFMLVLTANLYHSRAMETKWFQAQINRIRCLGLKMRTK